MSRLFVVAVLLLAHGARVAAAETILRRTDNHACRAHLVRPDGTRHRTIECGVPTETASDDLVWLEASDSVSAEVLSVGDVVHDGVVSIESMVPSTAIRLDLAALKEDERLSIVVRTPGHVFLRPVGADEQAGPIIVPVGVVFAFVQDRAGDVIRLSEVVDVVQSRKATPLNSRNVTEPVAIAFLDRAAFPVVSALQVVLEGDKSHTSRVIFPGAKQIIALWLDVPERRAEIRAESKELLLAPQTIALRPGRITTLHAALQRRPVIRVSVELPSDAQKRPEFRELRLDVLDSKGATIRQVVLDETLTATIEELPADTLRVVLNAGAMKFQRVADLRTAPDADLRFKLEPIVLSGTVYRGEDPVTARLHFAREGIQPIRTNEHGEYELTIWEPGPLSVDIWPDDDRDALPFRELLRVAASEEIDFHIPSAKATIQVTDRETSRAIEGANVTMRNSWTEPGGKRSAMQNARADAEGRVVAGALRAGTLQIHVVADGYQKAAPTEITIAEETNAIVPIALDRESSGTTIHVQLVGGQAAAGAVVQIATSQSQIVFNGTADDAGAIGLPDGQPSDLILLKHPAAGATVVRRALIQDGTPLRMNARALPLTIRVVRSNGEPAGSASVYVWIDGVRLGGAALAFLTGTTAATTAWGSWESATLPATAVRILVTQRSPAEVNSGAFDKLFATIAYPWAGAQDVRIAE